MKLTPFTIPDGDIPKWKLAAGYRVICGPEINVIVAARPMSSVQLWKSLK